MNVHVWNRIQAAGKLLGDAAKAAPAAKRAHVKLKTDKEVARMIANEFRSEHGKTARGGNEILGNNIKKYLARLKKEEYEIGIATHNSVLSVFSRVAFYRECRQWFEKMRHRDIQSYNNVLTAYAKAAHTYDVKKLWSGIAQEGLQPTSHSFVAVLTMMKNDGRTYSLREVGKVLKAAAPLNIFIMNSALNVVSNADDAHELFTYMLKKTSVTPDRFTLLAVLGKCDSNTTLAEEIWTKCIASGIVPTVKEWTALLAVYKDLGAMRPLHSAWTRLAESVKPSEITYSTFIKGCVQTGSLEDGHEKYIEALKTYNATSPRIHTNMMQLCAAANNKQHADAVMANITGLALKATPPLLAAYNSITT
eukprot:TRINITY_DN1959_c0_g1_i1.p1 TRINITY_DN1959_c0_g1~~TRINITY_DN1959_c0_g1_i1.p1  ORF type:complete len:364 (+),score=101.57 TRINITY_DN1959_c0_g1_i1:55-1146(+)